MVVIHCGIKHTGNYNGLQQWWLNLTFHRKSRGRSFLVWKLLSRPWAILFGFLSTTLWNSWGPLHPCSTDALMTCFCREARYKIHSFSQLPVFLIYSSTCTLLLCIWYPYGRGVCSVALRLWLRVPMSCLRCGAQWWSYRGWIATSLKELSGFSVCQVLQSNSCCRRHMYRGSVWPLQFAVEKRETKRQEIKQSKQNKEQFLKCQKQKSFEIAIFFLLFLIH